MSTIRDLLNQPKQPVAPEVIAGVKALHGSKVEDGGTYCSDCGARLLVGGYESCRHRDPRSGARGACPNARWPLSTERVTLTGLGWLVATEGN